MATGTYERLRDLILSNQLSPASALTEVTLAERLGVSRTPVREALKQLEQDGLVERSGRSVRIKERSPEEILEIYEVRIVLEGAVASAAARRRTEFDCSRMEAIHEEMCKLTTDDVAERVVWNDRFHEAVRRASHNSTLDDVIERLISHLARYPRSTLGFPGRWELVLREHAELLDAVVAGDPDRAAKAAAEHMTLARDTRLKMYAREINHSYLG